MPRGRIRETPKEARRKSEKLILHALLNSEKKSNKELLVITKLSAPTLGKRLADLQKRGKIILSLSGKDRRIKYYSLTVDGWKELEKELLKTSIENTPLVMNRSTLRLKTKWPEWYVKHKGWDDPQNVPFGLNEESHISPIVFLEQRNSAILKKFRRFVFQDFSKIMKERYPGIKKEKLEKGLNYLVDKFFEYLQKNFRLSLFSSLKIKPPKATVYDLGLKAHFLPNIFSQMKTDFLTEKYISFFESYLEFIFEIIKRNKFSIEELFVKDEKGTKIILVLEFDFTLLFENMKFHEDCMFNPKEFEKYVKEEYPILLSKDDDGELSGLKDQ